MQLIEFSESPKSPIVFNDKLNPLLWENNRLKTEIRYKLMLMAKHFANFLKVPTLNLKDITISGSNAAYGYSENSDIDLHLVVEIPADRPELLELYDAKKNQYNSQYTLTVKGIDVELYVQNIKQTHHSAGIYSILNDTWLSEPKKIIPKISDAEVKSKARNYSGKINQAMRSNDLNTAIKVMADIKRLRQAGLESGGEYSVENLAFKLLRARGTIDKMRRYINRLQSAELSLKERT